MMSNMTRFKVCSWMAGCMFLFGVSGLNAQDTLQLEGLVVYSGNPVPGVSISIEGSSMLPKVTDQGGEFTIPVPADGAWLIVSPTGEFKGRANLCEKSN